MKTHLYVAGLRVTFAVERETPAYEEFIKIFNLHVKPLLDEKTKSTRRIPKSDEEVKARMLYDMAFVMMTVGFSPSLELPSMSEHLGEIFKTYEYINLFLRRIEVNIDKYTDYVVLEPLSPVEEQLATAAWTQPEISTQVQGGSCWIDDEARIRGKASVDKMIAKMQERLKQRRNQGETTPEIPSTRHVGCSCYDEESEPSEEELAPLTVPRSVLHAKQHTDSQKETKEEN